MSFPAGARLGPYEIQSALGAGGMGEVYRARDRRLGRDVAIKVLPAEFSVDPERLVRFDQEARAAAALNHPNILAVHDIGQHNGAPYIVSELLEGETLRQRLSGGPLPVRKAVEYAIQITRGLAAAHDLGIVHRDLKPENIFLTVDGRVKILDFGLAKLTEPTAGSEGQNAAYVLSAAPTTPFKTQQGLVIGTIGYMSPEQVRGVPADHRSDIFAFGVVLYEMLTGRRAFQRETGVETMTAILKDDPQDLSLAERRIPLALERIIDRCLEKNPAARFRSADDLGFALDALTTHSDSTIAVESTSHNASSSRFQPGLPWIAALFFLATTLALVSAWFSHVEPIPPLVLFQVRPPPGGLFPGANYAPRMAISPDGQYLPFTVNLRRRHETEFKAR
jgi:serine/threonine protein kinase